MFNGLKNDEIIKQYEFDPGDIEKMIAIWTFYHPEENPEPKSLFSVYVNEKIGEISNWAFLQLLRFQVIPTIYWQERYSVKTNITLTEKPLQYLIEISEKFLENPISGLRKMLTISEESETNNDSDNKKKRKKKEK